MKIRLLALPALLIVLAGCINIEEESCAPDLSEFEEQAAPLTSVSSPDFENLPRKTVKEGELVSFPNLNVRDPDGDKIVYTFSRPLDENGEWQTKKGDAGEYKITITASDGANVISQKILLVVESTNKPPLIQTLKTIRLKAGETIHINPKINDPEGDVVTVTYSGWKSELPYKTTKADVGTHTIRIVAFDGTVKTTEEVAVIIESTNHAPKISPIDNIKIYELDKVMIVPEAVDEDNDPVSFRFSPPLDAAGSWIPKKGDAGDYQVEISASDGHLTDIVSFKLSVLPFNQPPVLFGVQDITINEGDLISLGINAEDPEGSPVEISYSGWMAGAVKQTAFNDAGEHLVTVKAFDGVKTAVQSFKVVVKNANRPPVFMPGSFE